MATIGTRINENGEEEVIIYDINHDLNGLIDVIDKFRKIEPNYNSNYTSRKQKVFITEYIRVFAQIIDKQLDFSDCIFEKEIRITDTVFKQNVCFFKTNFKEEILFANVIFQYGSDFSEANFQRKAFFSNIDFQKTAFFLDINFQEKVSYSNNHFQKEVDFSGTIFKKSASFSNTIFKSNTYFGLCEFHHLDFKHTTFHKLVDFYYTTFTVPLHFHLTNFLDSANFLGAIFEQEIIFNDCKVDSKTLISFQCATFKKGLDISTSNFNLCKLNFLGIRIENINEALSSDIYNNYQSDDTKLFLSTHHRLRETFRFIKNSLYAENNQIEGLEFYKKEMVVYGKELKSKLSNGKTVEKRGTTNPLWVDIIFAILCILLLTAYLYWCYIAYWGLVICMSVYFGIAIKKSNITKESIKKSFYENPLVYCTVWLLAFTYILCFFYTLHEYPKKINEFAWIIFGLGILASVLAFSNLTRDNIILFFNKYSNDFGTNWVNGVVFTFLCSVITFILMAIFSNLNFCFSYECLSNFVNSIIKIVNLVDTKPFENKDNVYSLFSKMNTPTYIALFIGRIFIGYGYYQTIQAFRKYGKS